jgi:hypothetical protein
MVNYCQENSVGFGTKFIGAQNNEIQVLLFEVVNGTKIEDKGV